MGAPRLVPVRIQSWAATWVRGRISKNNKSGRFDLPLVSTVVFNMSSLLPLIVKPELDGNLAAGVFRRQRPKRIDSLQRADGGLVQRRNSAGLLDANVAGRAAPVNVERQVDPASAAHARINFGLIPTIRYGTVYLLHVPRKTRAEVGILKAETAVGMGCGKSAIGAGNRATLPVRHRCLGCGDWTRP